MNRLILSIVFVLWGLLHYCSCALLKKNLKPEESKALAEKAIFEYLNDNDSFGDILTGKGLSKIDPLLSKRETLTTNGIIYFKNPMHSNRLKSPLPRESFLLVIPDSLANRYRYVGNDQDYEHDYSIIHQFSPLLPTIAQDTFLMEHYLWANSCDDQGCIRGLKRSYLSFKIVGQKVQFLEDLSISDQNGFIGFGGFPRKQMEEAGPGDKITKYGW
ncbi:MAG: hypothetical protein EPGJADBJ_05432 [Saprospiraceae bacterium]|nr:hypothetical protein [Saprospiraceae bacterium]